MYKGTDIGRTLKFMCADTIVFEQLHISKLNLVEYLLNNQEINTKLILKSFYNGTAEDYTDYAVYEQ